jgi:hypothetical protein
MLYLFKEKGYSSSLQRLCHGAIKAYMLSLLLPTLVIFLSTLLRFCLEKFYPVYQITKLFLGFYSERFTLDIGAGS